MWRTEMTTQNVNIYQPIATALVANTAAFIDANRVADNASTPFARSLLASVVGGLSSLAMAETLVIAAMGSPKSPATGKPVASVSGLRDFDGGARLYQAWKAVDYILSNIDADAPFSVPVPEGAPEGTEPLTVGEGLIRKAVVAFILNEGDVKALFGRTGIHAKVKALMAEHAKALATAMGVEQEEDEKADESANDNSAPQSLTDRATAMLVALQSADDTAFFDAQTALAALSDYIDTRWNAIADATAPTGEAEQPEAKAA
jgi:hypothetical protein